ncbi:hypothetical protein CLIB1423_11S03752 [[Candida] railenensis]|uniref:LIM zinc-binding domain-containing protein n=1 Tax=[Candida] railenensis TaxID=45579 RepID=A0A9P0QSK1_9ASCO|nr:hypothetical protein CLIB1423_11S03752 [[Candida] railenensis]
MTRLESLPKYFRAEPSPKIIDSAFPPFKVEHRYRGVYERAGFDVNLSGIGNKPDNSSIRSRPKQQQQQHQQQQQQQQYHHRQDKPISPTRDRFNSAPSNGPAGGHMAGNGPLNGNVRDGVPRTGSQTSHGDSTNSSTSSGSGERYRTQTFRSQTTASQTSLPKSGYQKPLQPYQSQNSQSNPSIHSETSTHSSRSNLTQVQEQNYQGSALPRQPQQQQPYGAYSDFDDPYSKPITSERLPYGGSAPEINNPYPTSTENPYAASIGNPYGHQNQSSISKSIPESIHHSHHVNPSMDGDFDFSPQPNHFPSYEHNDYNNHNQNPSISYSDSTSSRNKKNLMIKIQDSNYNHDDIDTNSVPSPNMFYDNSYNMANTNNSTQNTSVNRDGNGSPDSTGAVVEDAPPSQLTESQKNDLPYPIHRDQSLIKKNKRLSSSLDDFKRDVEDVKKHTPQQKQQPEFETFQDVSNHLNSHGNNEYQTYLNTQQLTPDGQRYHPRHSQMSMVSSILSKDSINDEDAEIERELERQLQSLKTGGENRAERPEAEVIEKIPEEIPEEVEEEQVNHKYAAATVPTFNIQTEDQYDNEAHNQDLSTSTPYPMEENLNEVDDDVPPRSIPLQTNEPFDPRLKSRQRKEPLYDDEPQSPSVPGLSINHSYADEEVVPLEQMDTSIEKELKFLNFPIDSASQAKQQPELAEMHLPGKGPCRTCFRSVLSNGSGSQKAIFSKTGELSGQWHRSCFECSYETCSIKFKKGIQCYALNDNPYCHIHYHELNNTLCQHCKDGIEGECIENELGQKWHLRCLSCYHCGKGIQEDYYLVNGEVFCESDALYRIQQDRNKSKQNKIEKRRTRLLFVD